VGSILAATYISSGPLTLNFDLNQTERTPSSVDIRGNRKTDMAWAKSLEKGWQLKRMKQFNNICVNEPADGDDTNDGWTWASHFMMKAAMAGPPETMAERLSLANDAWQERLRARVDSIVKDKETAEKLKPWYLYFCKVSFQCDDDVLGIALTPHTFQRPTFNDEYYETFNRDNTTLVDTDGKGIEKITPNGIVANGKEYPLDVIVFSTGFEVSFIIAYVVGGSFFDDFCEAGRNLIQPPLRVRDHRPQRTLAR